MSKMFYICAPLGGDIKKNVERVKKAMKEMIRQYKQAVVEMPTFVVPHFALQNLSFDDNGEIDRKWGMKMCMDLLRMCDEVIVIGEEVTAGMKMEMEEAGVRGIRMIRRREL
jgi:hypothetical protein